MKLVQNEFDLNFIDPKEIDQRLIDAENRKAQATRDEDYEKRPISVTKLLSTRRCKRQLSARKIFHSLLRKKLRPSLSKNKYPSW